MSQKKTIAEVKAERTARRRAALAEQAKESKINIDREHAEAAKKARREDRIMAMAKGNLARLDDIERGLSGRLKVEANERCFTFRGAEKDVKKVVAGLMGKPKAVEFSGQESWVSY